MVPPTRTTNGSKISKILFFLDSSRFKIESCQDSITEDSEGEEQKLDAERLEEELCRNVLQVVVVILLTMLIMMMMMTMMMMMMMMIIDYLDQSQRA